MIHFPNGRKICHKRGKNTSISAIKAVQKAPLRLLFLVKSKVSVSSLFWSPSLAESLTFYNRISLAKCTVGPDFGKLFLLCQVTHATKLFLLSKIIIRTGARTLISPFSFFLVLTTSKKKWNWFRSFDSVSF